MNCSRILQSIKAKKCKIKFWQVCQIIVQVIKNMFVSTPLYRGVKEKLLIASTSKESLLKLDNHQ